jgi:hypothetical protein
VSKITLSFLPKNVIVGAPHTIWKMETMDFVSLPPYDCLGMKELGIAIPQFYPIFSSFLVPVDFFLPEDQVILLL